MRRGTMKKFECRSRIAMGTVSTERFAREIVKFAEGARALPDMAEGAQALALMISNAIRSFPGGEGPVFPNAS